MLKYRMVEVDEVCDVICSVCKKSTKGDLKDEDNGSCEFAELNARWGYWSHGLDTQVHQIHFCQGCYEEMLEKMGLKISDVMIKEGYIGLE